MFPTQAEVLSCRSIYGDPRGRDGAESLTWKAKNLVAIPVPFKMTMGAIKITRISIHRECSASLARVLDRIWLASGKSQAIVDEWGISKFSGSFAFRQMRGLETLSMHAFGCAVDFDQANNALHDTTPRFAKFPQVLAAFKAEGWKWGGDWNGNGSSADERRCDGMHWQATR